MTDVGPGRKEYEGDRSADRAERTQAAAELREAEVERRRDPGPSGTEYQADKDVVAQAVRESRIRTALTGAVLFVTLLLAGFSVANSIRASREAEERSFAVREGQFVVCLTTANTLREDVRDEFIDLKKSVLIPVFEGVADTIPPPSPSKTILDESVAYMRTRVKTIDGRIPNLDCLHDYPPLEGQEYPPDLVKRAEKATPN